MFYKFWIGCTLLAALLIAGGMWVVQDKTKQTNRGNYLKKHYERFAGYQDWSGRSLWATAELFASDAELASALAGPPVPPPDDAPAPAQPSASDMAQAMFEAANGDRAIKPDLFVLFDQGSIVWGQRPLARERCRAQRHSGDRADAHREAAALCSHRSRRPRVSDGRRTNPRPEQ